MEKRVGTQREEVRRLVFKYRKDIVYLEEKEEALVRRIQILENLIPTVLIWHMWKVRQANKDVQSSQLTEEDAMNKLNHLETLLKELQSADEAMKKEEIVLRKRIEDLEESLDEDPFANIYVRPSSPIVSLTQDQVKSDIALMNKKIKKMNEKRLQFVDYLEDSDRDWQKTCEELVNEVNTLRDILDQSNVKLKESAMHIKKTGSPIERDNNMIKGKLDDLDNQTKLLYKDAIKQEKENIAREESQDEKVFSMVQDVMDEVDSLKQVLKDSQEGKRIEDQAPKDVGFKKPIFHKIIEEEEEEAETDLSEANSPIVYPQSAENKPSPLVLDFQDTERLDERTYKQNVIAPSTGFEVAEECLVDGPTTSSFPDKSVYKPGAVEVDTTTDIQLPPLAQVDQLQVSKESLNSLSLQSNILTTRASADETFPAVKKLLSKSDLSCTLTLQTVGDKYTDPSTAHLISGKDLHESGSLESCERMPGSSLPVNQNLVLDPPLSQPVTITRSVKFSPEIAPSKIVSPKPTGSVTSPHQMPVPERATIQASLSETTTEAVTLNNMAEMPEAGLFESSGMRVPPELTASKTASYQNTPSSPKVISEAAPPSLTSPDATIPVTGSVRTETVASKAPSHRLDLDENVTPQSPLSTETSEYIHPQSVISSKSTFPEKASLRTATVASKAPSHQTSAPDKGAPHYNLPKSTSETVSPPTNSSESVFPETNSLGIEEVGYKAPYHQTDPSKTVPTKPSSPEETSETVPLPAITAFYEATSLRTKTAVSEGPSNQKGANENDTNQSYPTDAALKAVSSSSTLPAPTPNIALQDRSEISSKIEEQSSQNVADSVSAIPGIAPKSQEFPAAAKLDLGKTAGNTITSKPYEASTDGDLATSSDGLMLEQEPATLNSHSSMDTLENQTVKSKCRVKDHLIKSLADQLREEASGNIWSGSKLLSTVSGDPVRTYDFDRHTLAKYLRGEGPKDIDASLRSDPAYSNTNQLNVKVLRKLDQSSLMIKWGPPPPQEVVGFQIFIDGEFMYWVHSATRNMALLEPLDLSKKLEISVSPVDSKGNLISRSSITYTPST